MSDVILRYRRREIRTAELLFMRELIASNPNLSRRALSDAVCKAWDWKQPNGELRAMVCRSLMLQLHRSGHIQLPPPRLQAVNNAIRHRRVASGITLDSSPIAGPVSSLGELDIRLVRRTEGEALFAYLLNEYHYLKYSRPVGEHLKYLIYAGERPVACMAWSSAPLQLNLRDQFIGAPKEAYRHNLHLIAYNTRFLVLPNVSAPNLASHLLSTVRRRISDDWKAVYSHPIYLLESFVDTERFRGVCYRAANWKCLGRSLGFGTKSKRGGPRASIKELWVYPLCRQFREKLLAR